MSVVLEPPAFDIAQELPAGVTVLEASAGTGKTYAITGLAALYVARGTPLQRILLVTFTRMATGELRERVRERLQSVERALRAGLGAATPSEDPVVALLRRGTEPEQAQARRRLAQALSDFDAATIATTHGFCQEALGNLGIAADLEPGVIFVEDLSDLVDEVLDDLYVRRFHRDAELTSALTRAQALEIARIAVGNPEAPLAPATGAVPEMRRRLAERVRGDLDERKRRLSVMTYDDLLVRLKQALRGEDGEAVARRMRARYDVVLVDEFQDTDPTQWDIMRLAFARDDGTLVLIADPKQAIYAFRGADIYAYLDAVAEAHTQRTLSVNRRSDQPLLDAYDALFGNARLGHRDIVYRRVHASAPSAPRLHGTALRLRLLERASVTCTPSGFAQTAAARERVAEDLAGDMVALLESDAEVAIRPDDGTGRGARPVCPGDVAVLVRTNAQAALVMAALERAGVPAVINGAGSVFATDSARHWLALLEALERPASITRAHAAALTPFLGWPAEAVAQADEAAWEELHRRLHEWARVLRQDGVASLLETVTREEGLPDRLLGAGEGERRLTDIRHVGQLLHGAATGEQLGTTALTGWLRRRIVEAGRELGDEERSRRLESDAQAVQVLTIHRSKGLEFPIVYLPYLWDFGRVREGKPVTFHDEQAGNRRTIDVALDGPAFSAHSEQHLIEERGEDLRLAYVALTRARHQAVVWWAGTYDSRNAPLGRLLFARDPEGTVASFGRSTPTDEKVREVFATLAAQATGRISVERARPDAGAYWSSRPGTTDALEAARFDRALDRLWRRTSYSDITAGAHETTVGSEPEEPAVADEPDAAASTLADSAGGSDPVPAEAALASPLTDLPVGTAAGTLIHQALEAVDFTAPDLDQALLAALQRARGRRAVALSDLTSTVAGVRAGLETPLGPVLGGRALRDVARPDRLDELGFELPLAGGEAPTAMLTLGAIAGALRTWLAPEDPLQAYARHLDDAALRQTVRGYLTGSIDLVVRVPEPGATRFAVLDYKTNWLAPPDEPLTSWHYRPQALRAEMTGRHYALQALLYLVALHRYLRWRLPGYDPERNLAGVLYLFLRGMSGPETPVLDGARCGVFAWQPPAGLVLELSDVLDQGAGR